MAPPVQELHFSPLFIPVTVDAISTINPASAIPAKDGDRLFLSNLDDMVGTRAMTPTVYFYKPNTSTDHPATVLRTALSMALVPYYPFSARLRETCNGKLEVYFGPEQGALVVEARSSMAMEELGALNVPNPGWRALLHHLPSEKPYEVTGIPLVIAQVTRFRCGGFSLGLRICHCLCDGMGAMQFVAAWAAFARDGSRAVVEPWPCWGRDFFRPREPLRVEYSHREFAPVEDCSTLGAIVGRSRLVQRCYRVSREFQAQIKQLAQEVSGGGPCTTFDAMSAQVWRSWVAALGVEPTDGQLRFTFSINLRPRLATADPSLPKGFYGNALCVACATATVGQLVQGRLSATAGLVRAARVEAMTEGYGRSTVDYVELHRPRKMELGGKLTVTQWTRFRLYETADFGWGRPVCAGPIDLRPSPQVCVFLPENDEGAGEGGGGATMVWICLPEGSCERFMECMLQIDH